VDGGVDGCRQSPDDVPRIGESECALATRMYLGLQRAWFGESRRAGAVRRVDAYCPTRRARIRVWLDDEQRTMRTRVGLRVRRLRNDHSEPTTTHGASAIDATRALDGSVRVDRDAAALGSEPRRAGAAGGPRARLLGRGTLGRRGGLGLFVFLFIFLSSSFIYFYSNLDIAFESKSQIYSLSLN
jgi:hypothetical protein